MILAGFRRLLSGHCPAWPERVINTLLRRHTPVCDKDASYTRATRWRFIRYDEQMSSEWMHTCIRRANFRD